MSLGLTLAMPVGSRWQAYHHPTKQLLGGLTVLSHRAIGIEVHWDAINKRTTLAYPLDTHWKLEGDHLRVAGDNGQLLVSYAQE